MPVITELISWNCLTPPPHDRILTAVASITDAGLTPHIIPVDTESDEYCWVISSMDFTTEEASMAYDFTGATLVPSFTGRRLAEVLTGKYGDEAVRMHPDVTWADTRNVAGVFRRLTGYSEGRCNELAKYLLLTEEQARTAASSFARRDINLVLFNIRIRMIIQEAEKR